MEKIQRHLRRLFWLLPVLSLAMHWRIFSTDLIGVHLWRQSQTQLNIQNFYRQDFNILHPRVNVTNRAASTLYRYEFPLMQWCVAALYQGLGESVFITRVCMFLLGLCTVYGVYFLIRELFNDREIALLTAWAFNFSPVFYYYTMNPIPDNLALCAVVWGLGWFFRFRQRPSIGAAIGSALGLAVAAAAKLPFILLYATPGWFLLQQIRRQGLRHAAYWLGIAAIFALLLFPALLWYALVMPEWDGNGVLYGIFDNQTDWLSSCGHAAQTPAQPGQRLVFYHRYPMDTPPLDAAPRGLWAVGSQRGPAPGLSAVRTEHDQHRTRLLYDALFTPFVRHNRTGYPGNVVRQATQPPNGYGTAPAPAAIGLCDH
jgi:4-amino-4-deoxy-L-arabinose transferase-like glycosyltransferase